MICIENLYTYQIGLITADEKFENAIFIPSGSTGFHTNIDYTFCLVCGSQTKDLANTIILEEVNGVPRSLGTNFPVCNNHKEISSQYDFFRSKIGVDISWTWQQSTTHKYDTTIRANACDFCNATGNEKCVHGYNGGKEHCEHGKTILHDN